MRPIITILAVFAILFSSCQREFDLELPADQLPKEEQDIMAVSDDFIEHPVGDVLYTLKKEPRKVRIYVSDSVVCTGYGGSTCIIRPKIFMKKDSSDVEGYVDLYFTDLLTYADMITNGVSTLSSTGLLETAGMFDVVAVQGTDTLLLKPGAIIDVTMPAPFLPGFSVYNGLIQATAENSITWEPGQGTVIPSDQEIAIFGIDTLTWTSVARPVQPGTAANIYVMLPSGFTAANTLVYLSGGPARSIFNLVENNGLFIATAAVPVGRSSKVVVIGKENNNYYYSENSFVTGSVDTVKFSQVPPITLNGLRLKLDALQ
jgi:hypothetical protein